MIYKLSVFILIMLSAVMLKAQSVSFRFNTGVYSWQRIDSLSDNTTAKTSHVRGYQNLLFYFNSSKWSFNTLAQTEEDLTNKSGKGFNYRLYNAYIEGANLFNMVDVKLGRQYLFQGVGKGTFDGISLKVKAGKNKEYQISLYGGALTPLTYDFKDYPSPKFNFTLGGQFAYYGVKDLMLAVSFTKKNKQPVSYFADRLDSLYSTTSREITFDPQAMMLAGIDARYSYKNKYDFFGKAYVDIILKKFYRGEFNASAILYKKSPVQQGNVLRLTADYYFSQPQIALNSIFWVFEHTKNQEITGGLAYTLANNMTFFAKAGTVIYDKGSISINTDSKDNSLKIEGGMVAPSYGITYSRYMGYAGESDGGSAYYNREILKSKFTVTTSVGFANYRLGAYKTDATGNAIDKVNSFNGILGINFRPIPKFSIDVQGQYMFNRIYKSDVRLLAQLNYWFFKKI